jgi:hypothetical protein
MNLRNRILATVGAAAFLVSTTVTGLAATSAGNTASVQITPNANAPLSVSITSASFGAKDYSFANQTTSGSLTLGATDERGNQGGWSVSLSATNFVNGSRSIPVSGLTLTPGVPTLVSTVGTTPAAHTRPAITPGAAAQTIWSAPAGEGDGQFSLPVGGNLVIPGGTLVGTYVSTVTVSINGNTP